MKLKLSLSDIVFSLCQILIYSYHNSVSAFHCPVPIWKEKQVNFVSGCLLQKATNDYYICDIYNKYFIISRTIYFIVTTWDLKYNVAMYVHVATSYCYYPKIKCLTNLGYLHLTAIACLLQLLLEHLIFECQLLAKTLYCILHVNTAQHLFFEGLACIRVHLAEFIQLLGQFLLMRVTLIIIKKTLLFIFLSIILIGSFVNINIIISQ